MRATRITYQLGATATAVILAASVAAAPPSARAEATATADVALQAHTEEVATDHYGAEVDAVPLAVGDNEIDLAPDADQGGRPFRLACPGRAPRSPTGQRESRRSSTQMPEERG